ncbi:MAG: hypothetical protein A2V81_05225 [Candidatus Abawacabacteria bacterium RBG_16_42_10]|uniref:D-alanyl-D-alanine dipeptidase n=1 Tax=Candidatus Abawacabacteria bacterium RBG_16_42_10 TaxID=1817814 RepID=A0A1F4XJ34_9BACT|nr:MAG: hypothetical protein A2V81_05225 [Candidatus Abawacabacteria bacterium RBG_16_42_10]
MSDRIPQSSADFFGYTKKVHLTLIAAPEVVAIPIQENNEPLVDIMDNNELVFDEVYNQPHIGSLVRRAVLKKLLAAQRSLPSGLQIQIREGYRPLEVQKNYWDEYCAKLETKYPTWSQEQIRDEAMRFVAPPDIVPPHTTGGAVDLTLVHMLGASLYMGKSIYKGKSLDMGTDMNDEEASLNKASYTANPNISTEARKNRDLLVKAMTGVGFINYPTEWWHWSYGDRYWAHQTKSAHAIYGTVLR